MLSVLSESLMCYCVDTVMAAVSVANIVKSSLGPVGLDKMLVDDVGVRQPQLVPEDTLQ